MRIFLDANVLFSAAYTDGAMGRFLQRLSNAGHDLQADAYVVEEARRNLLVKVPGRVARLEEFLRNVAVGSASASDESLDLGLLLPEKDRPILLSAIRLGCQALVTGDRTHFAVLYGQTIHGVTIYSPRSLAKQLLG
jgi:predicted nucleic acid-binding protein